uniref:RRM domain-containing protein n=1 Tax=Strigamia maritima TaxID=126957 RepID=T1J8B8_STRMM
MESDRSSRRINTWAEELEVHSRSIYITNVNYGATIHDLKKHFQHCGSIVRVTIPRIQRTGRSRGIAYIEFEKKSAMNFRFGAA